ncbi:MAG: ABC transporter ATP-binding protein [Bacilli bacterium]|nr:ABC transporter ATP-binding protein [Bacilli bacterium]
MLGKIPESIQKIILPTSTYNNFEITSKEKIALLKSLNKNIQNIKLSENMQKIMFDEIEINNTRITSKDQYDFLKIMTGVTKETKANEIYKKLDKAPKKIKKVVSPVMNINKIKNITLFLLCLYLCGAIFTFVQAIIMSTVSNRFANNLRGRISKKINLLPLKYFDKHLSGDILSRVTNDVDTIAQTMNQSLASLISSITLFIGTIIMMFVTNWTMALTAIISSLIGFIGMALILKNSQKYFKQRQEQLGNLNGHIEEIYSGLNVVKAYNGKEEANKKFDKYNAKVCESNKKSQFISGLMQPIMFFIGNFGYVAVCIVGALLTMNNVITFGVIIAFITYVRLFTSPLSQIAQAMTSLQSAAAASERVFEFLEEKEMVKEETKKYLEKTKVKGEISFENVAFRYDNNKKPTIKNFTAKAKPGEKIAIVGPTGAGKTTMVNLLMKFYDIEKGDIKIDGVSTKDLTRKNIHELFTMVLQDTWLFDGTIKENIKFNKKNITDKEIEKICEEVGLDHFIKTLNKGYETPLSDNDSISAGQRQLLTIARGMTENSPFLILDEATSNVDTRTEELVAKAMDKLAKGKTSFIIAHRLSTIRNADLILVMNDGNIIEQGTHESLMKKNGFYTKLYNAQFEE